MEDDLRENTNLENSSHEKGSSVRTDESSSQTRLWCIFLSLSVSGKDAVGRFLSRSRRFYVGLAGDFVPSSLPSLFESRSESVSGIIRLWRVDVSKA